MYLNFYNLEKYPFNLTPDTSFLYLSEKHQEALAHLGYGVYNRKGFIVITGEIGVGKTTICREFLKTVSKDFHVALILNPILTGKEFLSAILRDLGIQHKARTVDSMLATFTEFVAKGNETVILIDEAQNLSLKVLEQLRLLGNIETETRKLVQLILVGQPELQQLLNNPKLQQLNQRVAVRYHISNFSLEETKNYIEHRLAIAGNKFISFEEEAIRTVHTISKGIPRTINILCDYALLAGYVKETYTIPKELIEIAHQQYIGKTTLSQNPLHREQPIIIVKE